MYRRPTGQMVLENFVLPFEGKHDVNNRWVKLAKMIPLGENRKGLCRSPGLVQTIHK